MKKSSMNMAPNGRIPAINVLKQTKMYQSVCRSVSQSAKELTSKGKVDHAPVWSIGGGLISLSVATSP